MAEESGADPAFVPSALQTPSSPVVSTKGFNRGEGPSDKQLARLYTLTNGKAWEPPDLRHPKLLDLIARGYVVRCTMRCGFEAFDTGVQWTEAGRKAVAALTPKASADEQDYEGAAQGFAKHRKWASADEQEKG